LINFFENILFADPTPGPGVSPTPPADVTSLNEKLDVVLAAEDIICIGGNNVNGKCQGTDFAITNSMIASAMVIVLTAVLFLIAARGGKLIPGRWQALIEYGVEAIRNLVEGTITNKAMARAFFPFLCTLFFFILIGNWLTTLPGLTTTGWYHAVQDGGEWKKVLVPFYRPQAADLNFTFVLATVAVLLVIGATIRVQGFGGWIKEFFPKPYALDVIFTPLEIISPISRLLSLAFRLFGNIFAGDVLLLVIGTIAGGAYVIFMGLEIFIGFIQALVFTTLTIVYLAIATTPHHGHEEHHDDDAHEEHGEKDIEKSAPQLTY
jgi:F-type H+-transporting ATPase subunit a